MIEIIPNYHPIFVHFTLGLLGSAVGLFVLARIISKPDLRHQLLTVAHWNLWLGALVTIITVGAGFYAFNTVDHDDPSHVVMLEHRNLALGTFAIVLILAAWSWRKYRPAKQVSTSFLAVALFAGGLLVSTAWHGAELVFRHGLGVISLPDLDAHQHGGDGHAHEHGSAEPPVKPGMDDMTTDSDMHMDEHSHDDEDDHHDDEVGDDHHHDEGEDDDHHDDNGDDHGH